MLGKLTSPCKKCVGLSMTFCHLYCLRIVAYQARLDEREKVWAHLGEWFYEPLINLYLCDEDTKRKVRELWQSLKKGL